MTESPIASLQFLPPRQRAVLLPRDVLAFSASEVAQALDMSVAQARAVLDRYVEAFENSDAAALERLLTDDAVLEMTGVRTWFRGNATCVPHLRAQARSSHACGQLLRLWTTHW